MCICPLVSASLAKRRDVPYSSGERRDYRKVKTLGVAWGQQGAMAIVRTADKRQANVDAQVRGVAQDEIPF